ncbi:MAG: vitamin K epoxide reductase family protein [Candidatus Saccharibacteria bacterium]
MIRIFQKHNKDKLLYLTIIISSLIGILASFLQLLEKINILENPSATLICNINYIFNCTNILDAWQSSFFGFPNSLMCIIFFAVMLTIGLVGWTGSTINKILRLVMHFFTTFFLGFGFWYLWQSIFSLGSICIFCLFCYSAVLGISFAWLRINIDDLPMNKSARVYLKKCTNDSSDILIWLSIALIIIAEIILKFF